jgi:SAM-dependent methyltransferase
MTRSQNIYDDRTFFEGYRQLRNTGSGLNEVIEQPALMEMLPEQLDGLRVLDLGCGFGNFARQARMLGAASVLAVDISERMLAEARARTRDPMIAYRRVAIENVDECAGPFDVVVSSLALHYVADYDAALRDIAGLIREGGLLAFSVEHPIMTALPEQRWRGDSNAGGTYWPVDDYLEEGARHTRWFVDGVVKYHRAASTYVRGLLSAGFCLTGMAEPAPTAEAIVTRPDLADHRRRPPLLLLAGRRIGE